LVLLVGLVGSCLLSLVGFVCWYVWLGCCRRLGWSGCFIWFAWFISTVGVCAVRAVVGMAGLVGLVALVDFG